MKQEERENLIKEQDELLEKVKGDFPSPKDMRRIEEITSLLMTDGKQSDLKMHYSKPRASNRVTSFTRDRR